MKKKIFLCLMALTSIVCLWACSFNNNPDSSPITSSESEQSSTDSAKGDPDFPFNDFGKDNEATYPNAWD